LAAAAAAAVTIGFLPTLTSFGAGSDGLRAAGRAAAQVPGRLLTDSPAVAYASRKAPGDVIGSRLLPSGREEALAWLRAERVTSLVLEDIDYYRGVQVFPDLAAGRPEPPFRPLGDEQAYQAPGGKTVYAYSLSPPTWTVELAVGAAVSVVPPPAAGKTAPLAKGLVLLRGGQPLSGEGMGFGVPIVRYPEGWVYAGTAAVADVSAQYPAWRKVFDLDTVGGDRAHGYLFQKAPSRGRIQVTYYVAGDLVRVEVLPLDLQAGWQEVVVLNEQSSAFDDYADAAETRLGSAISRWSPVEGDWARFRSRSLGLEWSLPRPPNPAGFYAGREAQPPDFDWSGLEYSFGPGFYGQAYTITVQKAR
ncbi:MAG TPA: hypothetical protein VK131_04635, partial [Candidatus Acidoferrales bacterium]|nr:hypothetical protein [Candidatus Acidoferrales bacterium]